MASRLAVGWRLLELAVHGPVVCDPSLVASFGQRETLRLRPTGLVVTDIIDIW
jgi:hypothetical protein